MPQAKWSLPAQSLFTLITTDEWFAVANFRETDLDEITIGDCATVYSMIDRTIPIRGSIQGIGWGVRDQDRINLPRSVPYVERSLNWVRVAQRFPVRIRLEKPPQQVVRLLARVLSSKSSTARNADEHGGIPIGPCPAVAAGAGRFEFALRVALICALTVLVVEIYQTPEPALTVMLCSSSFARIG